ncbi:uncharacterized protein ACOB8E_013490 [Sarcophilus harrisii]
MPASLWHFHFWLEGAPTHNHPHTHTHPGRRRLRKQVTAHPVLLPAPKQGKRAGWQELRPRDAQICRGRRTKGSSERHDLSVPYLGPGAPPPAAPAWGEQGLAGEAGSWYRSPSSVASLPGGAEPSGSTRRDSGSSPGLVSASSSGCGGTASQSPELRLLGPKTEAGWGHPAGKEREPEEGWSARKGGTPCLVPNCDSSRLILRAAAPKINTLRAPISPSSFPHCQEFKVGRHLKASYSTRPSSYGQHEETELRMKGLVQGDVKSTSTY